MNHENLLSSTCLTCNNINIRLPANANLVPGIVNAFRQQEDLTGKVIQSSISTARSKTVSIILVV